MCVKSGDMEVVAPNWGLMRDVNGVLSWEHSNDSEREAGFLGRVDGASQK
jgi:hypothetical protein